MTSLTNQTFVLMLITFIVTLVAVATCAFIVARKYLTEALNKHVKYLEELFSSDPKGTRVVLETDRLSKHFVYLSALFMEELNTVKKGKQNLRPSTETLHELIVGWIDHKTQTLTLTNSRNTAKLIPLIENEFADILLLDEINSRRYKYGDDHAYEFDTLGGDKIYLSNNDFLRDFMRVIESYDEKPKFFFK